MHELVENKIQHVQYLRICKKKNIDFQYATPNLQIVIALKGGKIVFFSLG